jgi:3-isopropylmalate dehydrogenase
VPSIAVLGGDGIGPEIIREAVRVLARVRPDVDCVEAPVGGAALERGLSPLPDATRELCARSDAILFGAVGLPNYDAAPMAQRPEAALFALRSIFGLYANLRPVRVFPGLENASSLRPELVRGLDLVVVRELTGGLYFGPRETRVEDGVEVALDTMIYRAPEIERILRVGFDLARARRKHLTSVDKENVLDTSRLWRRIAVGMAAAYPDVTVRHLLVDNAAMQLVRSPAAFDVIVTENTFGDILSDEAAIVTGSIGTLPSASLGSPARSAGEAAPGKQFGMYEPIGGTAPDIAGKGVANPTAAILSAALLLRHSLEDDTNATRIERAVEAAYASGRRTADVAAGAASLSTTAFADAVLAELQ